MFERFIAAFLGAKLGKLAEFEPLAKHTTLRVGGPARVFVQPKDKADFVKIVKLARELQLQFKVLGKGSNLLASDELFEGVVIQTDKGLTDISIEATRVTAGAGVSDIKLAQHVARAGLSGIEFLSGIPGTIGGAVFMNAGAYLKEIADVLVRVQVLNEQNEVVWLDKADLNLAYRQSIFQQQPKLLILEAVLQLEPGDADEILAMIKSRKAKRVKSQPLELASAGSTFRNPAGHTAWQLIADAGLRGYSVGGAMVSQKHTNFVVNVGGATAQELADVILHVQNTVYEYAGLLMHQEVEFFNWGMK